MLGRDLKTEEHEEWGCIFTDLWDSSRYVDAQLAAVVGDLVDDVNRCGDLLFTSIGTQFPDIDPSLLVAQGVKVGNSVACWQAPVRERGATAALSAWVEVAVGANPNARRSCAIVLLTTCPQGRRSGTSTRRWLIEREDHLTFWLKFGGERRDGVSRNRPWDL